MAASLLMIYKFQLRIESPPRQTLSHQAPWRAIVEVRKRTCARELVFLTKLFIKLVAQMFIDLPNAELNSTNSFVLKKSTSAKHAEPPPVLWANI
eukprot:2165223-Amphidinium_carterae.1